MEFGGILFMDYLLYRPGIPGIAPEKLKIETSVEIIVMLI